MLYDATAHPLLSADASRLPSETIAALNESAEDLLKLSGSSYADADAEKATRAVALQINYMVTAGIGGDAFVYSATARGGRSWSYQGSGGPALVNPLAKSIIDSLPASGDNTAYTAQRSRRRGA